MEVLEGAASLEAKRPEAGGGHEGGKGCALEAVEARDVERCERGEGRGNHRG